MENSAINDAKKDSGNSRILWITGLSGAGKTTLATYIAEALKMKGKSVVLLDGDELRSILGATDCDEKNHGREGRLLLAKKYAQLCKLISSQGCTVIIATISLFHEIHIWNRKNLPGYIEIFLDVPEEELRRRDIKEIYKRYDSGEIKNVAGLDLAVDRPTSPDCTLVFDKNKTIAECASEVMSLIGEV